MDATDGAQGHGSPVPGHVPPGVYPSRIEVERRACGITRPHDAHVYDYINLDDQEPMMWSNNPAHFEPVAKVVKFRRAYCGGGGQ